MKITRAEALSEIRATAKRVGLTFKTTSYLTINGSTAYEFCDKVTGLSKFTNCTFWSAYENCQAGYIDRYDSKTGRFLTNWELTK
jgi:hypothetical protein